MKTAGRMARERVMSRRTQGWMRQCMKPSMTTWPASVPVIVLLCRGQQGDGEQRAGGGRSQQRGQRQIGDTNPVTLGRERDTCPPGTVTLSLPKNTVAASTRMAAFTKKATVSATVESMVLKRIARRMDGFVFLQLAALHQGGVQVEIVRHHRGADDADGHVQHARLAESAASQARVPFPEKRGWVSGRTKISMK